MSKSVLGKDFIQFLKDHGYINDDRIVSISIYAHYKDVVDITVNKHMCIDTNKRDTDNESNR